MRLSQSSVHRCLPLAALLAATAFHSPPLQTGRTDPEPAVANTLGRILIAEKNALYEMDPRSKQRRVLAKCSGTIRTLYVPPSSDIAMFDCLPPASSRTCEVQCISLGSAKQMTLFRQRVPIVERTSTAEWSYNPGLRRLAVVDRSGTGLKIVRQNSGSLVGSIRIPLVRMRHPKGRISLELFQIEEPKYSPRNDRIALVHYTGVSKELLIVEGGKKAISPSFNSDTALGDFWWAHDGRSLLLSAYTNYGSPPDRLLEWRPGTRTPRGIALPNNSSTEIGLLATYPADGRIAAVLGPVGSRAVWVLDAAHQNWKQISKPYEEISSVTWSPTGQELAFLAKPANTAQQSPGKYDLVRINLTSGSTDVLWGMISTAQIAWTR